MLTDVHEDYCFTVHEPKPVVGHMELLPGLRVTLTEKPYWFYRLTTRLILGWKWRDK